MQCENSSSTVQVFKYEALSGYKSFMASWASGIIATVDTQLHKMPDFWGSGEHSFSMSGKYMCALTRMQLYILAVLTEIHVYLTPLL